jgi:hypothetical protein
VGRSFFRGFVEQVEIHRSYLFPSLRTHLGLSLHCDCTVCWALRSSKIFEPVLRAFAPRLSECRITDASVILLSQLKSLRELAIGRTGITATGKARLIELLPQCRLVEEGAGA